MDNFCGTCGTKLDSGTRFCGNCGTGVAFPALPSESSGTSDLNPENSRSAVRLHRSPVSTPSFPLRQQIQAPPYAMPTAGAGTSNRNRWILMGVAALAALLV